MAEFDCKQFILETCREAFPVSPVQYDFLGSQIPDCSHCDNLFGGRPWEEVLEELPYRGIGTCTSFLSLRSLIYYLPLCFATLFADEDQASDIAFCLEVRGKELWDNMTITQRGATRMCLAKYLAARAEGQSEHFDLYLDEFSGVISTWFGYQRE
jgi:hypothetical protein